MALFVGHESLIFVLFFIDYSTYFSATVELFQSPCLFNALMFAPEMGNVADVLLKQ